MKTQTSTLPILLHHARKRGGDALAPQPVGIPTGTLYSHTRPCDRKGQPASQEILVLVKLTGGPMVMGSLEATSGEPPRIGSRLRMVLDEGHAEEQPASHRHRFEAVMSPIVRPSLLVEAATA